MDSGGRDERMDVHGLPPEPQAFRLQGERMLLKAQPSVEGGQRVLYLEASTEAPDLQDEVVLLKALESSRDYFLRYGRIDLDHASVTGRIRGTRVNPYAFEIGRPLDARVDGNSIFVKAGIWSSKDADNRFTEAADLFWDSLHTVPAVSWFPSVAGDVLTGGETTTQHGGRTVKAVSKLRWHSIGLSRTPVNPHVAPVSTVPLRAFAKAFGSTSDLMDLLRGGPMPQAPQPIVTADTDADLRRVLEALLEAGNAGQSLEELVASAPARGLDPAAVAAVAALILQPKGGLS